MASDQGVSVQSKRQGVPTMRSQDTGCKLTTCVDWACTVSRYHLGKVRPPQQACGSAHKRPVGNSPAALTLPASKCPLHTPFGEAGQGLDGLALLLHTALHMSPPGCEGLALGAASEVDQCPLRYALLAFGQVNNFLPTNPGC